MHEQEDRLGSWLERTAAGRRVLLAKAWLDRTYFKHVDRYHQANEGFYRFWTRLVVIMVIMVALAGAILIFRPSYHHYQEQRGAREAEVYFSRGDYRNAQLCALQALRLNGSNVPACRVMAQLSDLAHAPQTVAWLQRVAAVEPTLESKLMLAAAGLRYEKPPFPTTAEVLANLPDTAATNVTYQLVAASFALGRNQLAEAESHFATAARLDPTNKSDVLNLAILRLGMTNEAKQIFSRNTLAKLSADTNFGSAALRAMISDRIANSDLRSASQFSGQLLAGGKASIADQLQNLGILLALTNDSFATRLRTVQAEVATNAAAVVEVSAWMQSHGMAAESIQWLTTLPEKIRSEQPVQLATAGGYFATGNWRALRDFVSAEDWKNLEFLRFALVSHACAKMGMSDVANVNWNAAVNEAVNGSASSFEASARLVNLATEWGLVKEREELLDRMVERFPKEHWAATFLTQIYFSQGRTAALNQLSGRLSLQYPNEIAFKNNLAATALLLKSNLAQAYQLAAAAYTNAPENPSEATTYAYALHLQGRDHDGLALLERLPLARLKDPAVALYYGLLLNAVGRHPDALPWLQIARTDGHLLPEETELLKSALGP